MPSLRNTRAGYGLVTVTLHWLTVAALAAQLAIGWTMDADAAAERAEEQAEVAEDRADDTAGEEVAEEAADAAADRDYVVGLGDGLDLLDVHVTLGVLILVLAFTRIVWRRVGGLPDWAQALSPGERKLATLTERALLSALIVAPATGLVLVLGQDDDLLWLHVASHLVLYAALVAHLGLVLWHTAVRRDRLLGRMLRVVDHG